MFQNKPSARSKPPLSVLRECTLDFEINSGPEMSPTIYRAQRPEAQKLLVSCWQSPKHTKTVTLKRARDPPSWESAISSVLCVGSVLDWDPDCLAKGQNSALPGISIGGRAIEVVFGARARSLESVSWSMARDPNLRGRQSTSETQHTHNHRFSEQTIAFETPPPQSLSNERICLVFTADSVGDNS